MQSRLVSAVALITVVAGAAVPPHAQSAPVVATDGQQHAAPTTVRVHGTIASYDVTSGVLSLTTDSGVARFELSSTSRVRRGERKVGVKELQTLTGYRAAVRYADAAGHRIVESVSVFGRTERNER